MEPKIRILLVEDDSICLECLTTYLETEPDLSVTVAMNQEEAIRVIKLHDVDVVLLDAMLTPPYYDGLDTAIEMLNTKPMKIIMLTSVEERDVIIDAFTIGVLNYVNKTHYKDIPSAIRDAHHNIASIHPDAAASLRREVAHLRRKELQQLLTPMEKEILLFLGNGYTRRQTAQALNITTNTVKFHIRQLIKKIGGRTGRDVADKIKRRGLL
ncbi:response regulator transcription factor [Paenibacillus alginolyticus]|uniref:response regulator transcription factor n=1 Tax=Paenibacillus alginolyticus TaxID=59839 RepID=UPI0004145476|nr:response regulator transcription factor [Paenibacillus alginolyticus]MCY9668708.1 response regulator transcription factor [Paenibacillus alginolyticus]